MKGLYELNFLDKPSLICMIHTQKRWRELTMSLEENNNEA